MSHSSRSSRGVAESSEWMHIGMSATHRPGVLNRRKRFPIDVINEMPRIPPPEASHALSVTMQRQRIVVSDIEMQDAALKVALL